MPKIIDVIHHKNKYYTQHFLVVDRLPKLLYERKGNLLTAKDGIFGNIYQYEKPGINWEAFAGREFEIPMIDGTAEKAYGQWWDTGLEDYTSIGIGTIDSLKNCYVFTSYKVRIKELSQILSGFKNPSNNYYKYDDRKHNKNYMVNIIKSKWDDS
jgi:hypothetical protein